jgi:Skp family chaperone for outer membrane proteins
MTDSPSRKRSSHIRTAMNAVAAAVVAVAAPHVYAQARIVAVVDMQRAASETNEGRNALTALKAQVDRAEARLAPQAKQLEGMKKRLEAHRGPPTPAIQRLYQQYMQQAQAFESQRQQAAQDVQQAQAQAFQVILTKMTPVMRELAQTQGYQIIVDATAVHYVPSQLNLTDSAIELYNRRNPAALTDPDAGVAAGAMLSPDAGLGLGITGTRAGTTVNPAAARADAGAAANSGASTSTSANTGSGGLSPLFFRRDGGR